MPARVLTEQEFNAIRDHVLKTAPSGLDEAGFNRLIPSVMDGAIAEAEHTPAAHEGSAIGRFVSNAWEMVNPVNVGLYNAVRHPVNTAVAIGSQMADQYQKGNAASTLAEKAGHYAAAAIPVLGPAAAHAGEQIAEGDLAGGAGTAAGLLAPALAPTIVRAGARVARTLPESAAAALERGATKRVVDVMAPKVGPNKTRFGGNAEDVAPAIAQDLAAEGAPLSRGGLHRQIGAKLDQYEAQLDAVTDARVAGRAFPTDPIVKDLLEKRKALTAEVVDASQPTPKTIVQRDAEGNVTQAKTAVPLGADVVPGPNAARVVQIDQAIKEIKALGPVARYESIRRIRQAYDGPAKAVYSPSMTADFLAKKGEALGAADVTGALRDHLAKWDPETAKVNAPYALYRKANDVLDATAEVERTRPKIGRQIAARMAGTILGEHAAGVPGAAAGYIAGPLVDAALSSGMTTQLKTAALMTKLAKAIRVGDEGRVFALTFELKQSLKNAGVTVSAATGRATSPSESQSQTTAPAVP